MDLEAIIRMEDLVYSIVYKRVPLNLIFVLHKKTGPNYTARFCILQKFSHIVHVLIDNLIILYFIKQRSITYLE